MGGVSRLHRMSRHGRFCLLTRTRVYVLNGQVSRTG